MTHAWRWRGRPRSIRPPSVSTPTAARFVADLDLAQHPRGVRPLGRPRSQAEQAEREQLRRRLGEIDAEQAPQLRRTAEGEARAGAALQSALSALAAKNLRRADRGGRQGGLEALQAKQRGRRDRCCAAFRAEPARGRPAPTLESARGGRSLSTPPTSTRHSRPIKEPAHCPLCMQKLDAAARAALSSFEEFVADDISSRLRTGRRRCCRAPRRPFPTSPPRGPSTPRRSGDSAPRTGTPVTHGYSLRLKAAEDVGRLRGGRLKGLTGVEAPPGRAGGLDRRPSAAAAAHAELERPEEQKR